MRTNVQGGRRGSGGPALETPGEEDGCRWEPSVQSWMGTEHDLGSAQMQVWSYTSGGWVYISHGLPVMFLPPAPEQQGPRDVHWLGVEKRSQKEVPLEQRVWEACAVGLNNKKASDLRMWGWKQGTGCVDVKSCPRKVCSKTKGKPACLPLEGK